jgi:hypothetical protein
VRIPGEDGGNARGLAALLFIFGIGPSLDLADDAAAVLL